MHYLDPVFKFKSLLWSYVLFKNSLQTELKFLNKSQWFSRKEIERIQLKRLKALIDHAYRNVPYYHFLMKKLNLTPYDFNKLKDLEKLPVITKKELRNKEKILDVNINWKDIKKDSTGGSTGRPLPVYFYKEDIYKKLAAALRFQLWTGIKPTSKLLRLWSHPARRSLKEKITDRIIYFYSYLLNERIVSDFQKLVRNFKPVGIVGTPSIFSYFANVFENNGFEFEQETKSIISSSEPLNSFTREKIENAFDRKIFDNYSSREILAIAYECSEHDMHINSEQSILENTDEFGIKNEILVTDLMNYAMPFIRYKIEDYGKIQLSDCNCGRELPIIKNMAGRTCDLLVSRSGRVYAGIMLPGIFHIYDWIEQYQIIQKTLSKVLINIVIDKKFNGRSKDEFRDIILNRCKLYFKDDFKLNVVLKKWIKPAKSGKHRFIISKFAEYRDK